jgi:hypothetical protein
MVYFAFFDNFRVKVARVFQVLGYLKRRTWDSMSSMFGFLGLSKTHGLKLIVYLLNTQAFLLYPQRLTKP